MKNFKKKFPHFICLAASGALTVANPDAAHLIVLMFALAASLIVGIHFLKIGLRALQKKIARKRRANTIEWRLEWDRKN